MTLVRYPSGEPVHTNSAPETKSGDQPPRYQLLADAIERQLKPVGTRLATGVATLDRALRGGLPIGKLVVVQGPPGSGKTGVLAELMYRWSIQSVSSAWLAADEAAAGVITRLGQLAGYARDVLECDDEAGDTARRAFAADCTGLPIVVIDPESGEQAATIEDAERVLVQLEPDGERVLFVDSLQTARCAAADGVKTSIRERIDAKLRTLKGIAARGTLVVTSSEVSRGAYRSTDRNQQIDPLASGKETGSIEYSADVLLALSSVRGSAGLIDVLVPKNRLGEKVPFRLRQDFARASFAEVELPADAGEDHDAEVHRAAVKRVREAVLGNPRLQSQRDVLAVCKGSRNPNARAFRAMELEGEIVRSDDGFYRLCSPPSEAHDDAE